MQKRSAADLPLRPCFFACQYRERRGILELEKSRGRLTGKGPRRSQKNKDLNGRFFFTK